MARWVGTNATALTSGSSCNFAANGSTRTETGTPTICTRGANGSRSRKSSPISSHRTATPHAPRHLWRAYWIPRNTYRGLHNTDPFIFGERFLYSNCGQAAPSKAGLKRLGEGSVIAFGSGKMVGGKRKWVLDTVLVVKDSIAFDPLDPRGALAGNVPDAFLSVTGGPLTEDPKLARKPVEGGFRLYSGATPDDPVCGMYSFFPASPASDESCFARPVVSLDGDHFNPRSWQTPKGTGRDLPTDELRQLWESLVEQVRGAELVLGTYAQLPERRLR